MKRFLGALMVLALVAVALTVILVGGFARRVVALVVGDGA
jgi:hypothetical protein